MHVRAVGILGVLGLLALAGCSDGDPDDSADPTVPTAASTSTTAAAADVSVIPAEIDAEYLNRVLAALDAVEGEAVRIIVARKDLVPEAIEILDAIYGDREFRDQQDVWLQTLDRDPELKGIKPSPGNRRTTVDRLISSSQTCVWVAVSRDYSATATAPGAPAIEFLSLRPVSLDDDPKSHNPTAWQIDESGFNDDGSEPRDPCGGS